MPVSDSPAALVAHDVHREYHIGGHHLHVLKGVNLEVQHGERVFLCGTSGAGKTTLLYTLGGLERPSQGDVHVNGLAMYAAGASKRAQIRNQHLGFVFQNYHLLPDLTALENVALPSIIRGQAALDRAKELLARVGLEARLQHLPTELSGGEQQRVALARSLINNPAIILADEPTGNLDAGTGKQIMEMIFNVVAEEKKTLVVVTHDVNLATKGDRRLMLREGKLVAD